GVSVLLDVSISRGRWKSVIVHLFVNKYRNIKIQFYFIRHSHYESPSPRGGRMPHFTPLSLLSQIITYFGHKKNSIQTSDKNFRKKYSYCIELHHDLMKQKLVIER